MKENVNSIKREEIILSKRSKNLEELRGKVEVGQGSVGEESKVRRG